MDPVALTLYCSYARSEQKRARSEKKRASSAFSPGRQSRSKLVVLRLWQKRLKSVHKRARSPFGPETDFGKISQNFASGKSEQKRARSEQKRASSAFSPGRQSRSKLVVLRLWQKRVKSVQKRAQSEFCPEIDPGQNTLLAEV